MHTGIITGEYPPMQGGVGAYTQILAHHLARQGQTIFVFSDSAASDDDPAISLTNTATNWNFATVQKIRRWIQHNQINLVNIQFQTAAYKMSPWIHFLPQLLPVPVITTFHDLRFPYLFPKAGKIRNWIVMHLAKTSASAIVTNHEDEQHLQHIPGVTLIPIGSNIATKTPENYYPAAWRKIHHITPDCFMLVYFGFINHSKGVDTLLQAIAKIHNDIPAKLIMIGGRTGASDPTNATYAEAIDTLIETLDITDYIHWTGFIPDEAVSAWLNAADLAILPFRDGASYRRGSLMAAIEHECAILTTTPQVEIPAFQHDENLYLIPPENLEKLADAIKTLHDNPAKREKLKSGAARLRHEFDWQHITASYINIFEQVLS